MPTTTATADNRRTAIPTSPPADWERETPKYRVTIKGGVYPSPNSRFRFEPPFTSGSDTSVWQYAERPIQEGEIIETRSWPHASFFPLNYAAQQVLRFFHSAPKSRLPRSPWADGRIRLEDGLTGTTVAKLVPPQIQSMDMRPVRF
jgi:hypothetical protein